MNTTNDPRQDYMDALGCILSFIIIAAAILTASIIING